jgi:hypothetical protein
MANPLPGFQLPEIEMRSCEMCGCSTPYLLCEACRVYLEGEFGYLPPEVTPDAG